MPEVNCRYELVRGEVRERPFLGFQQGAIAATIVTRLGLHADENGLGGAYAAGTGFLLESAPDHVRAPDLAFVRRERVDAVGDAPGFFPGPPDIAIEVILSQRPLHGSRRKGCRLPGRWNAGSNRRKPEASHGQGPPLTVGHSRTDRIRHAGGQRHRARMANARAGHVRVATPAGTLRARTRPSRPAGRRPPASLPESRCRCCGSRD